MTYFSQKRLSFEAGILLFDFFPPFASLFVCRVPAARWRILHCIALLLGLVNDCKVQVVEK